MHKRHQQTLSRIFAQQTPADLRWSDIEALLNAAGAELSEGDGSRVRVVLNGVLAVFHRPHPSPVTKRGMVRAVRDFFVAAGIRPERE
jgi:hypothetical protein